MFVMTGHPPKGQPDGPLPDKSPSRLTPRSSGACPNVGGTGVTYVPVYCERTGGLEATTIMVAESNIINTDAGD